MSVGSSAQQALQTGMQKGRGTDGDEAMGPPEHPYSDGDAELGGP